MVVTNKTLKFWGKKIGIFDENETIPTITLG